MSWITKVTDFAEKAEDLLNRLDQSTGDVIHNQKVRSSGSKPARSSSYAQLRNENEDSEVHTEELGRSGPSLPSRTHSEFAVPRRRTNERGVVAERDQRGNDLMAMLNEDVIHDMEETRSRRSSGDRSVLSAQTAQSSTYEQAHDVSQMKSQLWAKETQIVAMKTKISELERKLAKRSEELFELKAEKEMVEQKLAQHVNVDSVEEKKTQEQCDLLLEECAQLRRKCMAQEEEVRAMDEQLRLAKFNLNENKKEFDQYKEKAQKILQAKEKLVDSLKSEQNMNDCADRPGHLVQAELEEMRVERDLARADLESAQLMVYNLRSEIDEMENQLREEQGKQTEQRKQYLEEKQSWHATVALLNEKVDCARIESEFQKQEMRRQSEEFAKKLELQEAELRKNVQDQRARRREEELSRGTDGLSLGERLLQKQIELEEALKNNQILALKLERLQCDTLIADRTPKENLLRSHHASKSEVYG
ncbi:hypothetical protein NECAME_13377 [Necator americanus]|uniref:Uncharacterized protein n=1 Tax=Necator americanus TaxID=51031 RepID=W2SWJ2_NECAM|nr:hypothetical protein NECAME_13377 [Necator americanus]ETN73868.1 hypothetical protein NECAME_13377 [Necator americanus]